MALFQLRVSFVLENCLAKALNELIKVHQAITVSLNLVHSQLIHLGLQVLNLISIHIKLVLHACNHRCHLFARQLAALVLISFSESLLERSLVFSGHALAYDGASTTLVNLEGTFADRLVDGHG